jgi:hypothetical protein
MGSLFLCRNSLTPVLGRLANYSLLAIPDGLVCHASLPAPRSCSSIVWACSLPRWSVCAYHVVDFSPAFSRSSLAVIRPAAVTVCARCSCCLGVMMAFGCVAVALRPVAGSVLSCLASVTNDETVQRSGSDTGTGFLVSRALQGEKGVMDGREMGATEGDRHRRDPQPPRTPDPPPPSSPFSLPSKALEGKKSHRRLDDKTTPTGVVATLRQRR